MYRKLILEIQSALQNSAIPDEFLIDLAAEYTEACQAVNQRLEQVNRLLNEGYRCEAIELAEQPPALLDLVAELNFHPLSAWNELLATRSLEASPSLAITAADSIEQAYDDLKRLEPLLKTHRKLALSQAPLKARIAILNRLADADPLNPLWQIDTEQLQEARLRQIRSEFKQASARQDGPQLQALAEELALPWRIAIPTSLQKEVAQASRNLFEKNIRHELAEVCRQLNQCLVEMDDAKAETLREKYLELSERIELDPNDELSQQAREALNWLSNIDHEISQDFDFKQALHQLELAVERGAPLAELNQKIYEVEKFDREIPEMLSRRVRFQQEHLTLDGKRKFNRLILMIGAAVVLLLAGFGWFVTQQMARKNLLDKRAQMAAFLESDAYEAGDAFFQGLPENLRNDSSIIQSHTELLANRKKESERVTRFEAILSQINLEGPLDRNLDSILDEGAELAVTDNEKKRVEILRNNLATARQVRMDARYQAFMTEFSQLQTQIENYLRQPPHRTDGGDLRRLEVELKSLLAKNSGRIDGLEALPGPLKQTVDVLLTRAQKHLQDVGSFEKSLASLEDLKTKTSSLDELSKALKEYARLNPDCSNADSFVKSSGDAVVWTVLTSWQKAASDFNQLDLENISPESAQYWKTRLENLEQKFQIGEWKNSTLETIRFLDERMKTIPPPPASLTERLRAFLAQATPARKGFLRPIKGNQFQWYYVENQVEPKDPEQWKVLKKSEGKTLSMLVKDGDLFFQAWHPVVAQELINQMADNAKEPADKFVLILLDTVFEQIAKLPQTPATGSSSIRRKLDPLVTCEMIDQILLLAYYAAPNLKDFAEQERNKIRDKNLNMRNWLDWEDSKEPFPREKGAAALVEFQESLKMMKTKLIPASPNTSLIRQWSGVADYKLAGVLYAAPDGDFLPIPLKPLSNGSELFRLTYDNTNKNLKFESVGQFQDQGLDKMDGVPLIAGQPLFEKDVPANVSSVNRP
jgi:hypothetical protein